MSTLERCESARGQPVAVVLILVQENYVLRDEALVVKDRKLQAEAGGYIEADLSRVLITHLPGHLK